MQPLYLLTLALMPLNVLAAPSPLVPVDLEARTPLAPDSVSAPVHALIPRQSLTDILGEILPALQALGQLLNAGTINNIGTVINGLATVLGDDRAQNTANLLDLLSGDLLNQLQGLLPAIGGLLSEDNINKIQSLVNNANDLLSEQFVDQTTGLINDVAPLVSAIAQIITTLLQALLGG